MSIVSACEDCNLDNSLDSSLVWFDLTETEAEVDVSDIFGPVNTLSSRMNALESKQPKLIDQCTNIII